MCFGRASECFFRGGFEPSLRGRDRRGPSKIVLRIREALRLVNGRHGLIVEG
jgi:hypothetical protein